MADFFTPDFDRNRVIDQTDRDRLNSPNANGVFLFWVNDDKDEGFWATNGKEDAPWNSYAGQNTDTDGGDHGATPLKDRKRNFEEDTVCGVRDMVDFFPLRLDLPPKSHPLSPKLTYKLRHGHSALNIVYTSFTPDNFGNWFTNSCPAEFGTNRLSAAHNAPKHRVMSTGTALDTTWLDSRPPRLQIPVNQRRRRRLLVL